MSLKSSLLLIVTFFVAILLRFYKFVETLNLGTDQAAAYILADRIIHSSYFLLNGPLTSLWQLNLLPPHYYYIVAVIYKFSPSYLSLPLTFSFFNLASVFLIFLTGKIMFNVRAGLITSLLYAVAEVIVWYGRDFWEPHLVPFFIIVSLLFLALADKKKNIFYLHLSIFFFFFSFLYISSVLLFPVY